MPRLARLAPEEQRLTERIICAAGNLKEVAAQLEVSYPTLRKRVDALIESLNAIKAQDEIVMRDLLKDVEAGTLKAEEAARIIREMNGGA